MAKKYYNKKRYYKKAKWCSNIQEFQNTQVSYLTGEFSVNTVLVQNPVQSSNTVSQIYTVKNVEVTAEFDTGTAASRIESLTYYIMFVPQGMTVSSDYNRIHPEYIMAYKFYGSPEQEDSTGEFYTVKTPIRVKTRLSRKLNTGDTIVLFIKGYNTGSTSGEMRLNGLVRWWTKAN